MHVSVAVDALDFVPSSSSDSRLEEVPIDDLVQLGDDLADIVSLDERRDSKRERTESGIVPATSHRDWRRIVAEEKGRLRAGLNKDLRPDWTRATYPAATHVLTYWLIFGEDQQFADAWWLQYGTAEQQQLAREVGQRENGDPVLGGRYTKEFIEKWFRTEPQGNKPSASGRTRQRNIIPIDVVDAHFNALGLRLVHLDPRAFVAKPAKTENERLLRTLETLPTHDPSGQPLSEWERFCVCAAATAGGMRVRPAQPKRNRKGEDPLIWVAHQRWLRFMEVEALRDFRGNERVQDAHDRWDDVA